MSQNGQTHFKNLAAVAARFLKCVWPFWDIMQERVKSGCLFNKVAGLRPATLWKKTPTQVFSFEFCEVFKTKIFYRTPPADCFIENLHFVTRFSLAIKWISGFLPKTGDDDDVKSSITEYLKRQTWSFCCAFLLIIRQLTLGV